MSFSFIFKRFPPDLNDQAEDMFLRLVKKLAEKEGITEALKAENQLLWVQRMNAIRETATEIINNNLIYVFSNTSITFIIFL